MPSTMPLSNTLAVIAGVDKAWAISNLKGDGGLKLNLNLIEDLINAAKLSQFTINVEASTKIETIDNALAKTVAEHASKDIKEQKPPAITVRSATLADIPAIEAMAENEDWASGQATMEVYFKTSPEMWYVAENDQKEIVAYWIHNKLSCDVAFAYQVLVREDYRSKGVIRLFKQMPHMQLPSMGNCTACSLFRMKWEKFQWKLIGGVATVEKSCIPEPPPIADKLTPLTEGDLPEMCAYDKRISMLERSRFFENYGLNRDPPETNNDENSSSNSSSSIKTVKTLIARDGETGEITGFAVLRRWTNCFGLSPCYADSSDIALNLMIALVNSLDEGDQVYIPFPATCATTMALAHKLKLHYNTAEVRSMSLKAFSVYSVKLDMSKVYAVHEYWPV